jgi:hypothetical protein
MVMQYPETVYVTAAGVSARDSNGDWQVTSSTTKSYPCRSEYLRGGGFIKNADGTTTDFKWLLYLPLILDYIDVGTKLEVKDRAGVSIIQGSVARFKKNQFNCMIWLA